MPVAKIRIRFVNSMLVAEQHVGGDQWAPVHGVPATDGSFEFQLDPGEVVKAMEQYSAIKAEKERSKASSKVWPTRLPFREGDRVRTVAIPNPPTDWTTEGAAQRRFGVDGTVVDFHDSHGDCFDVRHEGDGTIGCYEARELAMWPLEAWEPLRMPSAAEMGISVRQAAPRATYEEGRTMPTDKPWYDYLPFARGESVETRTCPQAPKGWLPELAARRRFGVKGTVIDYNHLLGLFFEVRHEDGSTGPYDPSELVRTLGKPSPEPPPRHLRARVRDGSLVVMEEKEPGVWTTIMAGPADCSFFDVFIPADDPLRFGTWAAPPASALNGLGI